MSLREWGYWSLALGVSLCAHGWFWLAADAGMDGAGQGATVRQRVMLVGLRSLPVPVPAVVESEAEDIAAAVKPPEPPVRQPPPRVATKPKPARAASVQPPPTVANPPESALSEAPPAPPARPAAKAGGAADEGAELERRRLEYLGQLAAHIDGHKFYPRSARRRGLEGQVRVVFRVSPEGRVSGVTARGEHGVLERAAVAAVRAAQPLPLPPPGLPLPEKVSFVMEYRLR